MWLCLDCVFVILESKFIGPKGMKGDLGFRGAQGPPGAMGRDGPLGTAGPKGETGELMHTVFLNLCPLHQGCTYVHR